MIGKPTSSSGAGSNLLSAAGLLMSVTEVGNEAEVVLTGELDAETAPRLRQELHRLMQRGARRVTVDLEGIEFIDATALNVLVGGRKRLRDSDGDLLLRAPSPATTKVLEMTGLTAIFTIRPTG